MKRLLRGLVILTALVTMLSAFALSSEATELKSGIGIVTASGLRLRAKPNTDAEILNVAPYNDNVVVIRQVGDWYLVNYNLDIGYMHGDYLLIKERENIDLGYGSIDPALVNMRSLPSLSGDIVDQIRADEKVFIFGFNTGWYKVKYDGQIGYIRSDLVTLLEKPYENSGVTGSYSSSSNSSSSSDDDDDDDDYDYSYSDSSSSSSSSDSSLGEQIANYALQFEGYPYVYGGNGPYSFDCSGFTKYIYGQFGYDIYRTSDDQMLNGYSVSRSNLQPGDLVFFYNNGGIGHVGMYIGNDRFIHAANSNSGVVITSLYSDWYNERYAGARRIVG